MTMTPLIALGFIVWSCSPAAGADWTSIKIGETTEVALLASFGPPDEVTARFPWTEWSARWKKRPVAQSYVLRYTKQSSTSVLLVGPGGKADDAEVHVSNGRVHAVWWHYGGPPARAAAAVLRADSQLAFGPREAASRGAKSVPGGALFVDIEGPSDSTVRVLLQLK